MMIDSFQIVIYSYKNNQINRSCLLEHETALSYTHQLVKNIYGQDKQKFDSLESPWGVLC